MTPQLADKKKWQDTSLKFLYIFEFFNPGLGLFAVYL